MTSTTKRLSLLLALAALAVPAPSAFAQEPAVKPVPDCNGINVTDPSGDQGEPTPLIDATVLTGASGPANLDIVQGFFTYANDEVRANIQVADLSKTVPGNASTVEYYYRWLDASGVTRFVSAQIARDGSVVYEHGTQEGNLLTGEGTAAGDIFEGPNGVVSIVIPGSRAGEGSKLDGAWASAILGYDFVAVRSLPSADEAPDSSGARKAQTILKCAPPAPVAGGGGKPTVGDPPAAAPKELTLRVSPGKVSAKKAKKAITFTLTSNQELTKVSLKLAKGSKTAGTGSAKKVEGKGKVKLKLKGKLKPGTYKLTVKGVGADGSRHTVTFRVKVTK